MIEEAQTRHAFKVAAATGQTPARDVALLHVLYGTGMTATEAAQLGVADVLDERGELRRRSEVRAAIRFNGRARTAYWDNAKLCDALDAYFAERGEAEPRCDTPLPTRSLGSTFVIALAPIHPRARYFGD